MKLPADEVAVETMAQAVYERLNQPRDCGGKLSDPVWDKDFPGQADTFRRNQSAAWEALKPLLQAGRTPQEQHLINYIESLAEEARDVGHIGGARDATEELLRLMQAVFPEETR